MVEPAEAAVEAAQMARLTVVPVPEQPELPIPSPAAAQPALALAHERAPGPLPVAAKPADSAAAIPEVSWFDDAPAAAVAAELASVPPAVDARTKPEIADAPSRGIAGSPPHPGRADARAGSCGAGSGVVVGVQGTPLPFRASPLPSPPPQGGRVQALAEPAEAAPETAQTARLSVVPLPQQPELPIPTPVATSPALALAHERAPAPLPDQPGGSAATMPEVSWFDDAPTAAVAAEIATAATVIETAAESPPAIAKHAATELAHESAGGTASSLPPGGAGLERGVALKGDEAPSAPPPTPALSPQEPAPRRASARPGWGGEHAVPAAPPEFTSPPHPPAQAPAPPGDDLRPRPGAKLAAPTDPLAALLALSEEERIALFT